MRILIVDDEFVSRHKAQKILSEFGECDAAVNGAEALDAFMIAHEEGNPYQLITLDIQMPDMDGIEALKKIREWEEKNRVKFEICAKILMLTISRDVSSIFTSFREGCEAYLIKPFNREKLTESLATLELV